jgi:hypothetical protein
MDTAFPFGFPLPTAFYITTYVLTLAIHVVFMNYVLAGTGWLAIAYLRKSPRGPETSAGILKDWLPVMLSGAITAGVAPLLFLQILYKQEYYTANLLLFNRWMAILPVLIVGFYALYLLKSRWLAQQPYVVAIVIACIPWAAVAFTGYSWTENHLLSVRSPEFWGEFYATGSQVYYEPQLLPRLAMWAIGSVPTMVIFLAWQHWYRGTGRPRELALIAGAGLFLVGATAAWYYLVTDDATCLAFVSTLARPYFVLAILGVIVQALGWGWLYVSEQFSVRKLLVPTLGLAFTLIGMTVCREAVRITTLGEDRFEKMYPIHADAFGKGGFVVFLAFFVINAGLCSFVFWLVRHRSIPAQIEQNPPTHQEPTQPTQN